MKTFIFESFTQLHPTQRCVEFQRHLERPCIGIILLRRKLGIVFLQGLFICGCFKKTPLNFKSTTPEYIITGCNGTIPRLVNKAMQVVMRIFIGNNNKTVWGNLFTESTDMLRLTECRFKIKMFTLLSLILIGGKGVNLLFTPSINSFPHAVTTLHSGKGKSNLNSLLPINL